eukprot:scaffold40463_cov206-Amphora_coffeaeformis.AAC.3
MELHQSHGRNGNLDKLTRLKVKGALEAYFDQVVAQFGQLGRRGESTKGLEAIPEGDIDHPPRKGYQQDWYGMHDTKDNNPDGKDNVGKQPDFKQVLSDHAKKGKEDQSYQTGRAQAASQVGAAIPQKFPQVSVVTVETIFTVMAQTTFFVIHHCRLFTAAETTAGIAILVGDVL